MATVDELLERAAELETAHDYHRAAELRVQALGPKPYPVLICPKCCTISGWLGGADGTCLECWARHREHTWNEPLPDARVRLEESPAPLLRRVKRTIGVGTARDRVREWLTRVDPDETGPIRPEEGWEIEVPVKFDIPAPEGTHRIVRFDVQSYRFEYAAWRPCDTSRGGKPRRLVPREFPAALPIEQLAEAWNDFAEEVAGHNRRVWRAEAERRGLGGPPEDDERGTAALLG
jgi:hypothetical protein